MAEGLIDWAARGIFVAASDANNTWPSPEHPKCQKMAAAAIRGMASAQKLTDAQIVAGVAALRDAKSKFGENVTDSTLVYAIVFAVLGAA